MIEFSVSTCSSSESLVKNRKSKLQLPSTCSCQYGYESIQSWNQAGELIAKGVLILRNMYNLDGKVVAQGIT